MRRKEYVPQPTAAAIDTAMAKALSFESESSVQPSPPAGVRGRLTDLVGDAGSFERGFVQTAGMIIGGLLLGRLFTDNAALLGAMVPLALLASFITHKALRGLQPTKQWLATRPRQIALGVACSPALTWLSQGSFTRSEKATVWTAWSAALVGMLALFAS